MIKTIGMALAATLLNPVAAFAQEPLSSQEEQTSAYADLYAAISEGVDDVAMLDGIMEAVRIQFSAVPIIADAEARGPGYIDKLMIAMRPIFASYTLRLRDDYQPRMVAVLAEHLTEEEAQSLAQFYRSDLGVKLLTGVSTSYQPNNTMATALDETDVTGKEIEADLDEAARQAVRELTPEELLEIARLASEQPALLKMAQVNPAIVALRIEMENAPTLPSEERAIEAAIDKVTEEHFAE